MGLPKPLGPFAVSFVEFELRRTRENSHPGSISEVGQENCAARNEVSPAEAGLQGAPPMRIFYPTSSNSSWSVRDVKDRSWIPEVNYLRGFLCKSVPPSTQLRRGLVWGLSCMSSWILLLFVVISRVLSSSFLCFDSFEIFSCNWNRCFIVELPWIYHMLGS